jgi:hypothetical protein
VARFSSSRKALQLRSVVLCCRIFGRKSDPIFPEMFYAKRNFSWAAWLISSPSMVADMLLKLDLIEKHVVSADLPVGRRRICLRVGAPGCAFRQLNVMTYPPERPPRLAHALLALSARQLLQALLRCQFANFRPRPWAGTASPIPAWSARPRGGGERPRLL